MNQNLTTKTAMPSFEILTTEKSQTFNTQNKARQYDTSTRGPRGKYIRRRPNWQCKQTGRYQYKRQSTCYLQMCISIMKFIRTMSTGESFDTNDFIKSIQNDLVLTERFLIHGKRRFYDVTACLLGLGMITKQRLKYVVTGTVNPTSSMGTLSYLTRQLCAVINSLNTNFWLSDLKKTVLGLYEESQRKNISRRFYSIISIIHALGWIQKINLSTKYFYGKTVEFPSDKFADTFFKEDQDDDQNEDKLFPQKKIVYRFDNAIIGEFKPSPTYPHMVDQILGVVKLKRRTIYEGPKRLRGRQLGSKMLSKTTKPRERKSEGPLGRRLGSKDQKPRTYKKQLKPRVPIEPEIKIQHEPEIKIQHEPEVEVKIEQQLI